MLRMISRKFRICRQWRFKERHWIIYRRRSEEREDDDGDENYV